MTALTGSQVIVILCSVAYFIGIYLSLELIRRWALKNTDMHEGLSLLVAVAAVFWLPLAVLLLIFGLVVAPLLPVRAELATTAEGGEEDGRRPAV